MKKQLVVHTYAWLRAAILLAFLCLVTLACQPPVTPDPEIKSYGEATAIAVAEGVAYTAGYWSDGVHTIPCYWKGTQRVDLGGGDETNGKAYAIAVSGGIVYIAGEYHNGTTRVLCYWTGATRTELPQQAGGGGNVSSLFISESTVYTAGQGGADSPCYWSGATRTDLPFEGTRAAASSLWVEGGTVYTGGSRFDVSKSIPCYWTGTSRTDRSGGDSNYNSYILDICLSGGTVYTAGSWCDATDSHPTYWAGADRHDLPAENGVATSIVVSGTTVYTAGWRYVGDVCTACTWIDSVCTDLANDGYWARAWAMFVDGGSVYAAGYKAIAAGEAGIINVPCYWEDSQRVDLPLGPWRGP